MSSLLLNDPFPSQIRLQGAGACGEDRGGAVQLQQVHQAARGGAARGRHRTQARDGQVAWHFIEQRRKDTQSSVVFCTVLSFVEFTNFIHTWPSYPRSLHVSLKIHNNPLGELQENKLTVYKKLAIGIRFYRLCYVDRCPVR